MIAFFQVLLEASVRVIPVAAGVALVLRLARVRAGSVQHAAWVAVLGAMLLMPVLPYCVPSFAERYAQVDLAEKTCLLDSAALIRNGKKPLWYHP